MVQEVRIGSSGENLWKPVDTLLWSFQLSQAEDGDPALSYRPNPVRVVRGRGCNESFRAAVDRTYDAPLGEGKNRDVPPMEAGTFFKLFLVTYAFCSLVLD